MFTQGRIAGSFTNKNSMRHSSASAADKGICDAVYVPT